jgi:hypothetical protein
MIVRELLTRIGFQVDKKGEQQAKSTFERLKGAANSLGLALSAGAIAIGFKRVVDAASDVEETMNVVSTAFEDQTDAVLAWAKASGEAAGRSEFAMREYAATLGAVVGPTLGSAEATADLSTNMAQLAVDLGSFFNATDEEALDAIRAGLIGSQEPLLRFGVNMKVAALDAFALSEGLGKTTKDMNEAEKTMLRYRFILARTTKAQGDAEKTAEGFANQSKRLWGNMRTLAVAIGQELLPAATAIVTAFAKFVGLVSGPLSMALRAILNVFKFLGATIGGILVGVKQLGIVTTAVFGLMLLKIAALKSATFALKLEILATKLIAFAGFILMAAVIAGVIILIDDLWAGFTKGEGVLAGLGKEFMALAEENDSYLTATRLVLQNALDFWIEYFFGVDHGMARLGQSIRDGFSAFGEFMALTIELSNQRIKDTWAALSTFIIEKMQAVVDFLTDTLKPITDGIVEGMTDLVGLASDLGLGDLAKTFGFAGPENIAAPGSPAAAAAAAAAGNATANQTINVNVDAKGGDPAAIGAATGAAVTRAGDAVLRKTKQQLLAGGATP